MKTPDEIKKALEICASDIYCDLCPYREIQIAECLNELQSDVLGYIQQLEAALTEAKSDGMECIVEEEMW